MKITTVLPISRTQYLDRVLESLVNQTHKSDNLIVVFDGNENDFLTVRNKIVQLDIENVLCVTSNSLAVAHSIPDRRRHIANIHNQVRELIGECDWVFSIEDDGILPLDTIEKLVSNVEKYSDVGMFTGVELGRWGTPYVGAWVVENIDSPTKVTSLESKAIEGGIQEIDACGLYCALIRADMYKQHQFVGNNGLGADVNLGIYLRQIGFKNYIDWSIHLTHLTFLDGQNKEIHATDHSRVVSLSYVSGSTWRY